MRERDMDPVGIVGLQAVWKRSQCNNLTLLGQCEDIQ